MHKLLQKMTNLHIMIEILAKNCKKLGFLKKNMIFLKEVFSNDLNLL